MMRQKHFQSPIFTFCIVLVLWISNYSASAQDSKFGNWLLYFGNAKISNKFNFHHEVQYRSYDYGSDLEQLLVRVGIGWNATPNNNNLLLGYAFVHSENYINASDKSSTSENRIFQQWITNQPMGRLSVSHRYRIEERWLPTHFAVRFRYSLSFQYPINNSTITSGTLYASAYNELFINAAKNAFDRNRVFFGLGYALNPNLRFQLGYMTQIFSAFSRDQLNIIVFGNF